MTYFYEAVSVKEGLQLFYLEELRGGLKPPRPNTFDWMYRSAWNKAVEQKSQQFVHRNLNMSRHNDRAAVNLELRSPFSRESSHRITESQNTLGWKRCLRSPSPAINLNLSGPSLNHVPYLLQPCTWSPPRSYDCSFSHFSAPFCQKHQC